MSSLPQPVKKSLVTNKDEDKKIEQILSDPKANPYHKSAQVPIKKVPQNYKCHKCGNGGHFIQDCPIGKAFPKRATGIPRTFLQPATAETPGAKVDGRGKLFLHFFITSKPQQGWIFLQSLFFSYSDQRDAFFHKTI